MSLIDQEQKYLLFRSEEIVEHHEQRGDHTRSRHFVTLSYNSVVVGDGYKVTPPAMPQIYKASYQNIKSIYNSTTEELSSFIPFVSLYLLEENEQHERVLTKLHFGDPSKQTSIGAITSPSHINQGAGITRLTINKETSTASNGVTNQTPTHRGEIEFKLTDFSQLFINRSSSREVSLADLIALSRADLTITRRQPYPNVFIEYGWTIPGEENNTRTSFWRDSFDAQGTEHTITVNEDGTVTLIFPFNKTIRHSFESRNILLSNMDEEQQADLLRRRTDLQERREATKQRYQTTVEFFDELNGWREHLQTQVSRTAGNFTESRGLGPMVRLLISIERARRLNDPTTEINFDEFTNTNVTFTDEDDEEFVNRTRRLRMRLANPNQVRNFMADSTRHEARLSQYEQQIDLISLELSRLRQVLYTTFLLSLYNKGKIYYADIPSEITNAEAIRQARARRQEARARATRNPREPTPAIAGGTDPFAVTAAQLELQPSLDISIPDEEVAYQFCQPPRKLGIVPKNLISRIRASTQQDLDAEAQRQAPTHQQQRQAVAEAARPNENPSTPRAPDESFASTLDSYENPEDNTERVQYILLGDIIDSALAFLGRENVPEVLRDARAILGPVDLRVLGANIANEKYASSYNIPISLKAFNSFFFRQYINQQADTIPFANFIINLYSEIIGTNHPIAQVEPSSAEVPRSIMSVRSFRVPTDKDITNGENISGTLYNGHRNFVMPDVNLDVSYSSAGLNKRTYYFIGIAEGSLAPSAALRSPIRLNSIDVDHDAIAKFGIPTLFYGSDKSIVKSVTYDSTTGLNNNIENYLRISGYAGHKVYTASVEMLGNSLLEPFSTTWIEPTNIVGPGQEQNYRSLRQLLFDHRIMQAYIVTKVTEEITEQGYFTNFESLAALLPEPTERTFTPVDCEERAAPETTPETSPTPTPPATTPSPSSTSAVRVVDQRLAPGGRGPFRIDLDTPSNSSETLYFPLQEPSPRYETRYGYANTYNNAWGNGNSHDAIDIFPVGAGNNDRAQQKSIFSIISGTVAAVERRHLQDETFREAVARHPDMEQGGRTGKGGNYVIIHSLDRKIRIYYAHLAPGSIPDSIRPGATVSAGQALGKVGRTGSAYKPAARTRGAHHLHIDIKVVDSNGRLRRINPFDVLNLLQGDRNTGESPASLEDLYNYLNVSYDARGNRTGPGPREAQIRAAHPESEDS